MTDFLQSLPGQRWAGVDLLDYKPSGSAPFKAISRQVLIGDDTLACELRYFEIAAGGHSTLERHDHAHGVLVLAGSGACLVGGEIHPLGTHDLVRIPPWTWHQFRADAGSLLGFLCMVNRSRDRPVLPTESDLEGLRADPAVAAFIRT
ncbi:cupin domain-containing protein [uncultured Thiodictyon sp.]|uniref:cupin domain-containing protein n=1 Tax=uncultured Thiodictyon sp. TaxID=1846217 RepID=UPI0025FE02EF|nr:cupin domain-containing protein [uncultured Thiodictyon sp.]